MPPRRPNQFTQDKVLLDASTVAAISATTTIPLGTMDGDFTVDKFEVEVPGGYTADAANYYDISLQAKGQTFTAVAATDICTATGHGFFTGDGVQVTTSSALPAGLSAGVTYFVIVLDANTFKLATTRANAIAGTAIDLTTAGTGTQTISRLFAIYSLLTGQNGSLTDLVFGAATVMTNASGAAGAQLNAVLTKFGTGVNVAANSRLVAHCHQL